MDLALPDGSSMFAATGGRPFDPSLPVVVLIHGAGADHTLWRNQTRWLAHHGRAPLAVDLPGRGRSSGSSGTTIAARSDAVIAAIEGLGVDPVSLVGHSMGSLVALDIAGRRPELVEAMALLATTPTMGVHPVLIESARAGDTRCLALTRAWQHGSPLGGDETPGTWRAGVSWRLTEAVGLATYAADLEACRDWDASEARAAAVRCRSLVVSGRLDRMTTAKGGAAMASLLGCEHVVLGAGHTFPQEASIATTRILGGFLASEGT